MAAKTILSRCFVRVKGLVLATMEKSTKLTMGGVESTEVMGDSGFLGYTESQKPGIIECDVAVDSTTDLSALSDIAGETVTVESNTGQVWTMRNARQAMVIELDSSDGKTSLKFIGSKLEQS